MGDILLHGKRAVKVNAEKVVWANTSKASQYNIDGDKVWLPNSHCQFTKTGHPNSTKSGDIPGTLVIAEWLYNKTFPNG